MKKITAKISALLVFAALSAAALSAFAGIDLAAGAVFIFYDAIDRADWDAVLAVQARLEYDYMRDFLSSEEAETEGQGLFNIDGVRLTELYRFDLDNPFEFQLLNLNSQIREIMLAYDVLMDDGFEIFLAAVELDVRTENEAMRNGLDFHLEFLIEEQGAWKIAGSSLAAAEIIEYVYPADRRESAIDRVIELRHLKSEFGVCANLDGDIISIDRQDFSAFENFKVPGGEKYLQGRFSDIDEGAWYGAHVQNVIGPAYEMRIINGFEDGSFRPGGELTAAQAVKMAALVRSIYDGGSGDFTQGDPWYQVYVDYAADMGIIDGGTFDSYDKPVSRAEMAGIFARALPPEAFLEFCGIESVLDVGPETPYSDSILGLYRAGVLLGGGTGGAFRPNDSITRAEAAAVIVRAAMPQRRRYTFSS